MAPRQVLSLVILASGLSNAYMPYRPCSWSVCKGSEWKNDWSPSNIPQGQCVTQQRTSHGLYETHHGSFFCPPPQICFPQWQHRTTCELIYFYHNIFLNQTQGLYFEVGLSLAESLHMGQREGSLVRLNSLFRTPYNKAWTRALEDR